MKFSQSLASSGRIEVLTLSFRFLKNSFLGDLYYVNNGKSGFKCWTHTFVLMFILPVRVGSCVRTAIG